jgi:glycosyltransferase involved in cell wall biosynthesis
MVTQEAFPEDIRIEKEALASIAAGHEVFICTPRSSQRSDGSRGYRVIEFGDGLSVISAVAGTLHRVLRWIKPQILHVQDTPASLNGWFAAKSLALPMVFDIHEIWPSLILENSSIISYREVFWSKSLQIQEAITLSGADATVTVVDEASKYYLEKYRFLEGRAFSINNFEIESRLENVEPSHEVNDLRGFKAVYVGGIDGPIRGLQEVITTAGLLSKEDVNILIVGSGSYLPRLHLLAEELHIGDNIRFMGKRSFSDAMSIISASDVCLVPHRKGLATQNTLPHKISQYMLLQKPVISTGLAPIRRLFASSFIEWEPRTPKKLAELILWIRDNQGQGSEYSRRAYRLVKDRYRWAEEGKKLVAIYEGISSR